MNHPISPNIKCNKLKNNGLAGFDAETELKRKMETNAQTDTVDNGRSMIGIKDPGQPTQAQIDEHDLTHCLFRAWCSHCVRGQAPEDPHRRNKDGDEEGEGEGAEGKIPKVAIDYCFMGSKGLVKDGEWRGGEGREIDGVEAKDNPILVMQEDGHERLFAYPVAKKGAYEAGVKFIVSDIASVI